MKNSLVQLPAIERALAEVSSVVDAKGLADRASAVLEYARRGWAATKDINQISRVRLGCYRRAGEILAATVRRGGARYRPDTLPDGITKLQSSRWQRLARIPANFLDGVAATCDASDTEFTQAGLERAWAQYNKGKVKRAAADDVDEQSDVTSSLEALLALGSRFRCIYADPPWQYGNQATRGSTDNHYPTMSVDEICDLPISNLADDEGFLFLWTTAGFLPDAFSVLSAWGFTYKSNMVWVKPQMGMGNYVRLSHEHLLIATRGAVRFKQKNVMSWVQAPRGKHSVKPEEFRTIIEKNTDGPRIELFARRAAVGWTAWGNQVERGLAV